jgi:hypothetical protein
MTSVSGMRRGPRRRSPVRLADATHPSTALDAPFCSYEEDRGRRQQRRKHDEREGGRKPGARSHPLMLQAVAAAPNELPEVGCESTRGPSGVTKP